MYEIIYNDEVVGSGLSKGETNQWILDLEKELNAKDIFEFRKAFGFAEGNFENFLYDSHSEYNINIIFNNHPLVIRHM